MSKYTKGNSSNLLISKMLKRIGLFNFKTQISNFKLIVFVFNVIILTITLNFSFSTFNSSVAHAAPNYQLNYQGKLTNASNVAVSDGSYNIRFRLCTDSSCSSVIYTETHCYSPDSGTTCDGTGTDQRVTLTNGLFSTMIGSVVSTLSSLNFNQTLYLGVTVGGSDATPSWDPEMSPRKTLGTVPSSFEAYHSLSSDTATTATTATNATNASNSDTLDTYHESSFAFLLGRSGSNQTLIGSTDSNGTLTLQGTSNGSNTSTNANIQLNVGDSGGTTALTILNNGNVGIGDTSPDTILDILSSQASNTELTITNTNAGSYSPQIGLSVSEGTNSFTLGVDDNDSQKFKISTTALGTNDILTIDSRTTTSGVSTVTIQGSSATIASASNSKLTTLTVTPPTLTLTGTTQVTSQMDSTLINAPTITDNDAVTVDKAATLTIAGAPIKGGSVTLSNTYALKINSQAVSTATASYSLFVDAQTGATNNYAAVFNTGNVGIGTTTPQALLDVNGNILVSGSSRYINFDTTSGSSGYGFRDNSGTMEFKNSGGAWAAIPAGGGTFYYEEFTSSGTWTRPDGVNQVWILMIGAGGGGGGGAGGGGGGGGGYGGGTGGTRYGGGGGGAGGTGGVGTHGEIIFGEVFVNANVTITINSPGNGGNSGSGGSGGAGAVNASGTGTGGSVGNLGSAGSVGGSVSFGSLAARGGSGGGGGSVGNGGLGAYTAAVTGGSGGAQGAAGTSYSGNAQYSFNCNIFNATAGASALVSGSGGNSISSGVSGSAGNDSTNNIYNVIPFYWLNIGGARGSVGGAGTGGSAGTTSGNYYCGGGGGGSSGGAQNYGPFQVSSQNAAAGANGGNGGNSHTTTPSAPTNGSNGNSPSDQTNYGVGGLAGTGGGGGGGGNSSNTGTMYAGGTGGTGGNGGKGGPGYIVVMWIK